VLTTRLGELATNLSSSRFVSKKWPDTQATTSQTRPHNVCEWTQEFQTVTNKLYEFIKLQPLFIDVLTLRQPLLPSSERLLFTARCRHGEQLVVDMRKLVRHHVLKSQQISK